MGQNSVEMLLGQLITDDNFRERSKEFFVKACIEHGFSLTEEEHRFIRKVDFDAFTPLADALHKGLKRSRIPF